LSFNGKRIDVKNVLRVLSTALGKRQKLNYYLNVLSALE